VTFRITSVTPGGQAETLGNIQTGVMETKLGGVNFPQTTPAASFFFACGGASEYASCLVPVGAEHYPDPSKPPGQTCPAPNYYPPSGVCARWPYIETFTYSWLRHTTYQPTSSNPVPLTVTFKDVGGWLGWGGGDANITLNVDFVNGTYTFAPPVGGQGIDKLENNCVTFSTGDTGNPSQICFALDLKKVTTTQGKLPCILQHIFYEPPGDKSSVSYGTQNTFGNETEWSITSKEGVSVDFKFKAGGQSGFGLSDTFSQEIGGSVKTEKTTGTTYGISVNDGQDEPDHTRDTYFFLCNAEGTRVDKHDGTAPSVTIDPATGTIDTLTVYELQALAQDPQDLSKLPAAKAAYLAPLITPADAQQMLANDPFISGESIAGNKRYVPATPAQFPLLGPDREGDPLPTATVISANTNTTGSSSGTSNEVEFTRSFGINFYSTDDSVTDTFSIEYEHKTTNETSDQVSAQLVLGTDSLCTRGTVDMYLDTVFGSYLGVPHLTNQCQAQPMRMMSFEKSSDWSLPSGASSSLSNDALSGAHSLSVNPVGWTPLTSVSLTSAQLRQAAKSSNLSKVSFAVKIPATQPNPYWVGAAQMYLSSPSANVYNAYLGQVELTSLPKDQFVRLPFAIPAYALHALTEDHSDLTFTIVLNVNPSASGWLIDDLTIGQ